MSGMVQLHAQLLCSRAARLLAACRFVMPQSFISPEAQGARGGGQTWGAGRVQADVELVSGAGHFAEEALQGAHLVLLEGLVQVAADQPDSAGLDDRPARDGLHLLHALLRGVLWEDND